MNKQQFIDIVVKIFNLTNADVRLISSRLDIYKDFLQKQNKIMNLTRLDRDDIIWSEYFWHSILPYEKVNFNNISTVLDVGSGSGIPGIVLKIFFSHIHLTIVESNNKKCQFLLKLVELLKLDNVRIICKRVEQISKANQFDIVTAKAVAPLEIILELLVPFCAINGWIIVPKSKNYLDEVKNLNQELKQLSAKLLWIDRKFDNEIEFVTIYAHKIAKTNTKYPRDYKKIIKGFDYEK